MRTGWRRLILWDIDGTLAHSGTVATEIFSRAIEHVVGTTLSTTISFAGKTDRQITEEFLELAGSTDPGHVEIILDRVEIELAKRAERISADGTIFPGAKEAIEALSAFPEIAQTVLTGNIAANARLKLAAFSLVDLLDLEVGAYGRDHTDRTKLLPLAWRNQIELRHRSYTPDETWIVGDTPRDLACAQSGGAHCLLVATGRYEAEELEGLGADAVLPDLVDTARVVAILTGIDQDKS